MKLSGKPISSPGRAEKYPPPLMRFLRSNVGSRSRGRSRSSPMFVRKKNTAIETQEPSSPKVTCMGQVRVKRSKQAKTRSGKPKRRCKWIRRTLFRHHLRGKFKPNCFKPDWRKWVTFFHVSFKRKSKSREDSSKIEPKFGNRSKDLEQESEEEDRDEEEEAKVYVSTTISPPKNALLLTRCRSAPYRSSSLGGRFWCSPLRSEETEQKQGTGLDKREGDSPTSKSESACRESDSESRLDAESDEKLGFFKEFAGSIASIRERMMKHENINEFKTEETGSVRPLILTRCKSEPARIAEKLDPGMSFWKKQRLGFT